MMSTRYESLFTASQWQELEHQALIFKYMVSGMPIPSDLLFPIKTSLTDSSISSTTLFPHHHHQPIGWSCFQMGFGRKPDPEPGRCRRTDGKKWRCSKEAYPDSKYCEKHMHRGRNRSRKPVELTPTPLHSNTTNSCSNSSFHQSFYSHSSPSMKPLGFDFSFQNSNTDLALDSGGCHSLVHKNFGSKCFYGLKEETGEHSVLDDSWRLKMSSLSSSSSIPQSKQGNFFLSDQFRDQRNQQKEQHCFVLGADIKSERAVVMEGRGEQEQETEKPLWRFLDDKWSNKNRELNDDAFSTTQLSISIPMSNSRSPDW